MSNQDTLLKIGSLLNGKYIVEKYLGGGAFGEVYRVKHKYLKNRRAIKVFKNAPDIKGNPSSIQELLEEAILLTKFDHKHIVKVHDAGIFTTDEGEEHVFFEMDFYSKDLDEYWKSFGARFIPVDIVVTIIKQICLGLDVLHSEKPPMIHRDIKPQNIMVDFDSEGRPIAKLTDFGLVKTVSPSTLYASAKGTLAFKAPEFLEKKDDTSTDIFAVGVTFYMLLTDNLPYPIDSDFDVMTGSWLKTKPKPINEYNPLVRDKRLEDIVFTAISTDPEKRYRDAQELLDAIIDWENSKDGTGPDVTVEVESSPKVTPSADTGSSVISDSSKDSGNNDSISIESRASEGSGSVGSVRVESSVSEGSGSVGSVRVESGISDDSVNEKDSPAVPDPSLRSTYIGKSSHSMDSDNAKSNHSGGETKIPANAAFESDVLEDIFGAGGDISEVPPERNPEDLVKDALWAVSNSLDYQLGIDYLKEAFSQDSELKLLYGIKLKLWEAFVLIQNPNTIDEGIFNLKKLADENALIRNDYGFAFDLLSKKKAIELEKEAIFCNAYNKTKEASALIELAMLMDVTLKNKYKNKLKLLKNGSTF